MRATFPNLLNPSRFVHPKIIWWRVQIVEFIICNFLLSLHYRTLFSTNRNQFYSLNIRDQVSHPLQTFTLSPPNFPFTWLLLLSFCRSICLSFLPHDLPLKLPNGFILNLVSDVYTTLCLNNLVLPHMGIPYKNSNLTTEMKQSYVQKACRPT
jgi:hypothetical protein